MGAAYTVASKVAPVGRCRRKRVLTPGLAELFEPLIVSGAATHPVKILRNKWMVAVWQGKPIHVHRPFVTRISSQSEADAASTEPLWDCTKSSRLPTMTSGPGTVPGRGTGSAGNEADVTLPFSSRWLISIGCMVAPMRDLAGD